ncbi:hypothetical protein CMQ_2402 [Grosmannia clavigera kw1407]|uniref:Uncharacterized protein n=1 Tax=Grosmannia clavigera (strain kw1407 / UAMH 11150) TaxID=655863 RepID=F0XJ03_GROCL|nr:uncharacterized protein CMQ_2402 [Grosmannia clavigera kw1407]EFX02353.1 hypothetical protein CMQ_2402 [Grosmannia clavigera kw1407]
MSLLTGPSALLTTTSSRPEASVAVVAAAVTAIATLAIHRPGAAVLRRTMLQPWLLVGGLGGCLAQAAWLVWASDTARRLRRKVLFEFAATVLGPGGNGLILLILWPGWLVLAMGFFAATLCAGWWTR